MVIPATARSALCRGEKAVLLHLFYILLTYTSNMDLYLTSLIKILCEYIVPFYPLPSFYNNRFLKFFTALSPVPYRYNSYNSVKSLSHYYGITHLSLKYTFPTTPIPFSILTALIHFSPFHNTPSANVKYLLAPPVPSPFRCTPPHHYSCRTRSWERHGSRT